MKTFTYRDKTITIQRISFSNYMVSDGHNLQYSNNMIAYDACDEPANPKHEDSINYFYQLLNR